MLGDFILVKGYDHVGKLIRLGEIANGDGWHSLYSHAALITSNDPDPYILEAELHGARMGRLSQYEGAYTMSSWSLTDAQRRTLAMLAPGYVETPYSILDYGSLGLLRLGVRPQFVLEYVRATGHMICSQLVDEIYRAAGLQMFQDGRFAGDVTPQDLAQVLTGPLVT